MRSLAALASAVIVGTLGCSMPQTALAPAHADQATPLPNWPAQPGWKSETIPFPLGFAPSIELQGAEALRFAPDFYTKDAPGYFTYAFVWTAQFPTFPVSTDWLSEQLRAYFDGLCVAVSDSGAQTCAANPTQVAVGVATATPFAALAQVPANVVNVQTFDAFKANQPVQLTGTVVLARCGSQLVVAVTLAPAVSGGGLQAALASQAHAFAAPSQRCSAAVAPSAP